MLAGRFSWGILAYPAENLGGYLIRDPYDQFDAKIEELTLQFPEANIRQAPEPEAAPDAPFPVKFKFIPARRAHVPEYLRPMLDGHEE